MRTWVIGNEKDDELAKTDAFEKQIGPEPVCRIPKSLAQLTLQTYFNNHTIIHWRQLPGMNHSLSANKTIQKKGSI
ncbi:jg2300 [Pararge aegeria aegeria]|uniref:Jg2300 protein n=1 Tax=Pararge aegeria aegeria TaxID=348720 RepID=A0A8S4S4R3_9NEOP|nr:jg2300 [Pararge aegeria aegeria]